MVLAPSALALSTEQLDGRYAPLAGVASGYLPKDRAAVDEWHAYLRGETPGGRRHHGSSSAVTKLGQRPELARAEQQVPDRTDGIVRAEVESAASTDSMTAPSLTSISARAVVSKPFKERSPSINVR